MRNGHFQDAMALLPGARFAFDSISVFVSVAGLNGTPQVCSLVTIAKSRRPCAAYLSADAKGSRALRSGEPGPQARAEEEPFKLSARINPFSAELGAV